MEIWKEIPDLYGYHASNAGRVKWPRGILSQYMADGYAFCGTYQEGVYNKKTAVHRLVCSTFHDNPDGKAYVNHINGNRGDNRPENLEWATPSENNFHRTRVLRKNTFTSRAPILGCAEFSAIRDLKKRGFSQREIAKQFNVSQAYVSQIVTGKAGLVYKAADDPGSIVGRIIPLMRRRITEDDVRAIRDMRARGVPLRDIMAIFPIKEPGIRHIMARRSWAHVP